MTDAFVAVITYLKGGKSARYVKGKDIKAMSKPKMYGMNKPFIPNSKADQMKKRFKRKAQSRKARARNDLSKV